MTFQIYKKILIFVKGCGVILHRQRHEGSALKTYPKLYFKTPAQFIRQKMKPRPLNGRLQFSMGVTVETPRANVLYGDSQRRVEGV